MWQEQAKMTKAFMASRTSLAMDRMCDIIDLANAMKEDRRRAEREERGECKSCFYTSRVGGCAITLRKCMCCGVEVAYSSTATDVLCKPCALKHKLCRHCGGDRDMRTRRKSWPEPEVEEARS